MLLKGISCGMISMEEDTAENDGGVAGRLKPIFQIFSIFSVKYEETVCPLYPLPL